MDSEPSIAMTKAASPLLGYNTNARYKGKVYHIQTEDSGVSRPHIITHLFADGGRIIASRKTSYAQYLGAPSYRDVVKKLMQEQHKAIFMALREGQYDAQLDSTQTQQEDLTPRAAEIEVADEEVLDERPTVVDPVPDPEALPREDTGSFARKLTARSLSRPTMQRSSVPERLSGISSGSGNERPLSEKSLDEVILGYLAEEWNEEER